MTKEKKIERVIHYLLSELDQKNKKQVMWQVFKETLTKDELAIFLMLENIGVVRKSMPK